MARILGALPEEVTVSTGPAAGDGDAARAIYRLQKLLGAPTSLKKLQSTKKPVLSESVLQDTAALCTTNTERYQSNPTPFNEKLVHILLQQAWDGNEPDSGLYKQQPGHRL